MVRLEAAKTILALGNNLMYTSDIRDVASPLGGILITAHSNEELKEKLKTAHPALLIIDLSAVSPGWKDLVQEAKVHGVPVIAFGPQGQEELRKEAEEAGCHKVFVNSKFKLELSNLLPDYLK
jgi:DNA-binding response OmpR family regulator